MAGIERHIFPGNNTPLGFFSYYSSILNQREAERLVCIKGGPGTGKSTFMKNIGNKFVSQGESVDFYHCSSDSESLDGILLTQRRVAFIDATSPHMIDPINPGAVDEIVNLGECWDESRLRSRKNEIIDTGEAVGRFFSQSYNYLAAAGKVYNNLSDIYREALPPVEIYKITARLLGDEFGHRCICVSPGRCRKFFASGITPEGFVNHIKTLLTGMERIYLVTGPMGSSITEMLRILSDGAIYRGIDVEEYYCPMDPANKLEHLIIPEHKIAFISCNRFHDIEPWELEADDIMLLDTNDLMNMNYLRVVENVICESEAIAEFLLEKAVRMLNRAQTLHKKQEEIYISAMDYEKSATLMNEIIAKVEAKVL